MVYHSHTEQDRCPSGLGVDRHPTRIPPRLWPGSCNADGSKRGKGWENYREGPATGMAGAAPCPCFSRCDFFRSDQNSTALRESSKLRNASAPRVLRSEASVHRASRRKATLPFPAAVGRRNETSGCRRREPRTGPPGRDKDGVRRRCAKARCSRDGATARTNVRAHPHRQSATTLAPAPRADVRAGAGSRGRAGSVRTTEFPGPGASPCHRCPRCRPGAR